MAELAPRNGAETGRPCGLPPQAPEVGVLDAFSRAIHAVVDAVSPAVVFRCAHAPWRNRSRSAP